MGERVVTDVISVDGQIGDGDGFVGADVLVVERAGHALSIEHNIVGTHDTYQCCSGCIKIAICVGARVVHAIDANNSSHSEFFWCDVGGGLWLCELVVAGVGARDGETSNVDCLAV